MLPRWTDIQLSNSKSYLKSFGYPSLYFSTDPLSLSFLIIFSFYFYFFIFYRPAKTRLSIELKPKQKNKSKLFRVTPRRLRCWNSTRDNAKTKLRSSFKNWTHTWLISFESYLFRVFVHFSH